MKYLSDTDTTRFNFFDYLYKEGSPLLALFYSRLFWPDFVELQGMVFLKETIETEEDLIRLRQAMSNQPNKNELEKSFNRLEIGEMFAEKHDQDLDDEGYYVLAERLLEMWKYRLIQLFPEKNFCVEVLPADLDTGEDVRIQFYQN